MHFCSSPHSHTILYILALFHSFCKALELTRTLSYTFFCCRLYSNCALALALSRSPTVTCPVFKSALDSRSRSLQARTRSIFLPRLPWCYVVRTCMQATRSLYIHTRIFRFFYIIILGLYDIVGCT